MPEVFSPGSNSVDVPTLVLDQAPVAPVLGQPFFDENNAPFIPFTCPTTDFDGSPLTPNGSGSSGCDSAYLCGAPYAPDGTNPLDGLGGAVAVAGFLLHKEVASPGATLSIPLDNLPSLPGGGNMKLVGFVSDGSDV